MAHIVSSSAPPFNTAAPGDEWFNPTNNKLYKLVIFNGTNVGWQEQLTGNSTVATTIVAIPSGTSYYDPAIDPFLLAGM